MNPDEAPFEADLEADLATGEPALVVDVEGFEGPLDLLLALARQQKVDLAKISILALADQYLAFIEEARKLRLELAADYLVMAAWLAYLKSRLLLPETGPSDGPSAEDMATALMGPVRRKSLCSRVRWPTGCWPAECSRCSSTFPGTAVPRQTAIARSLSSRPIAIPSARRTSLRSGRLPICRWG